MKTKNRMIVFVGASLLLIGSGITQASAAEPDVLKEGTGQRASVAIGWANEQSIGVLKGGIGLACYPAIGCGDTDAVAVWQDGPGPVCFPGIGCGKEQSIGVFAGEMRRPAGAVQHV